MSWVEDIMTEPSSKTALQALTEARDLIADARWIKGDMAIRLWDGNVEGDFLGISIPKDTKPGICYCAIGALRYAMSGHVQFGEDLPTEEYKSALEALALSLTETQRKGVRVANGSWTRQEEAVIEANDRRVTRRSHIVALFNRAIVRASKAEAA